LVLTLAVVSTSVVATQRPKTGASEKRHHAKQLTDDAERRALVQLAQIWSPTNIPTLDLRAGPPDPRAFPPDAVMTCTYVEKSTLPGTSRKFDCAITADDVVKVRYGSDSGKVEGEVLASRLLWALGFGADRDYPVRVKCRGCAVDVEGSPAGR
jgi:hypothetical protein